MTGVKFQVSIGGRPDGQDDEQWLMHVLSDPSLQRQHHRAVDPSSGHTVSLGSWNAPIPVVVIVRQTDTFHDSPSHTRTNALPARRALVHGAHIHESIYK